MIANILSLLRIILAPITVILVLWGDFYVTLALCLFTVASITDFLDGYFARKYDDLSNLGAFLDPLADKVLIISILFSFYLIGVIKFWMLALITLRDVIVTTLRIITFQKGSMLKTSKVAKFKTTIQFIGIYILFIFVSLKSDSTCKLIPVMMSGIVIFTIWTGITYLFNNRKTLKELW